MKKLFLILIIVTNYLSIGQIPTPLDLKTNKILFINGVAHIGNGEKINKSVVGVENGKISLVGNALTVKIDKSKWDTIIDIDGQHLYPGFIATNSTIGLTEIDAVRATKDFREVGYINPHIRSLIAFNIDSKIIYTIRTNGVLTCQATPRGGLISGTSSVFGLNGWNWEDAVYLKDDGIHINWPARYRQTGWWAEPGIIKENLNYLKTISVLTNFFKESKAYLSEKKHNTVNLKYEAMRTVLKGNKRVYFHTNFVPEISDVIDFSSQFKLKNPVIVGGYDAHFIAERLKENHFTVMLSNPHKLPYFEGELPNSNYTIAKKTQDSGLLFCIQNAGNMEVMNTRNLPFLAGTAMAYGLTEEEAIASITLNTAKILGIDNKIGSIEEGKDATLFISKGSALDMRTNYVTSALIKGQFITLDNHQMQLAKKYSKKYGIGE